MKEGDRVLLAPPLDPNEKDLGGSILAAGDTLPVAQNQPRFARPSLEAEKTAQRRPRDVARRNGDRPRIPDPGASGGEHRVGDPPANGESGTNNFREMMKKFDTDGDGKLSDSERAAMRSAFRQMTPGAASNPSPLKN